MYAVRLKMINLALFTIFDMHVYLQASMSMYLFFSNFSHAFWFVCSDGFFFAVKEVSLRNEGPREKQSILQLDQVG